MNTGQPGQGQKRTGAKMETTTNQIFTLGSHRPLGYRNQSQQLIDLWAGAEKLLQDIFQSSPVFYADIIEMSSQVHEFDSAPPHPKECRLGMSLSARDDLNHHMYRLLGQFIKTYLESLAKSGENLPDQELLNFYARECKHFDSSVRTSSIIFQPLNKWVKEQRKKTTGIKNLYSIYEMTQILWKTIIFPRYGIKVGKYLLAELPKYRDKETNEKTAQETIKTVVKSCIGLGVDQGNEDDTLSNLNLDNLVQFNRVRRLRREEYMLKLYRQVFESKFLIETATYYEMEIKRLMEEAASGTISCLGFFEMIDSRFQEEEDLAKNCFHPSTLPKLNEICRRIMIWNNIPFIMNSCEAVLVGNNEDVIATFQRIMERAGPESEDTFSEYLQESIFNQVQDSINLSSNNGQAINPITFSECFIEQYIKQEKLIRITLEGKVKYRQALQLAFTKVLNENAITKKGSDYEGMPAQMLARHCDFLLKNNSQKTPEEDRKVSLNILLSLVSFLESKDVFNRYYQIYLSNRLLMNTSYSDDLENLIVGQMKFESNSWKLKTMFRDMTNSKDLSEKFKLKHSPKYNLTVSVITTSHWPVSSVDVNWNVPEEIHVETARFQQFYETEVHKGRKLQWVWNKSRGQLKYRTGTKEKHLQVTFEQASVLLEFSSPDIKSATIGQLLTQTKLVRTDLKQVLDVLASKQKILLVKGPVEDDESIVTVNNDWTSKKNLITLWTTLKSEKQRQGDRVTKTVQMERKHVLQAAIVRIMKTKKAAVNHSDIVSETIQQVKDKFCPEIDDINVTIQELIAKGYMKLEPDSDKKYLYIA